MSELGGIAEIWPIEGIFYKFPLVIKTCAGASSQPPLPLGLQSLPCGSLLRSLHLLHPIRLQSLHDP